MLRASMAAMGAVTVLVTASPASAQAAGVQKYYARQSLFQGVDPNFDPAFPGRWVAGWEATNGCRNGVKQHASTYSCSEPGKCDPSKKPASVTKNVACTVTCTPWIEETRGTGVYQNQIAVSYDYRPNYDDPAEQAAVLATCGKKAMDKGFEYYGCEWDKSAGAVFYWFGRDGAPSLGSMPMAGRRLSICDEVVAQP